jgi:hypothetical protein
MLMPFRKLPKRRVAPPDLLFDDRNGRRIRTFTEHLVGERSNTTEGGEPRLDGDCSDFGARAGRHLDDR